MTGKEEKSENPPYKSNHGLITSGFFFVGMGGILLIVLPEPHNLCIGGVMFVTGIGTMVWIMMKPMMEKS